jgi:hypothetical protein
LTAVNVTADFSFPAVHHCKITQTDCCLAAFFITKISSLERKMMEVGKRRGDSVA